MTPVRKPLCVAILMGLLVGHFGMAVHVSTHALGDAGQCEFCLSHNDVSTALPSIANTRVAAPQQAAGMVEASTTVAKRLWAPFLQRDPPQPS